MIKFRSFKEHLREANQAPLSEKQKESMQLSIAANETEARMGRDYNPASLQAVAVRHGGSVPGGAANELKRGVAEVDEKGKVVSIFKKSEKNKVDQQDQVGELGNAEQFPDAPHGDTLDIPDIEPAVSRTETSEAVDSSEKMVA